MSEKFRMIVTNTNQIFAGKYNKDTNQFVDVVEIINVSVGINERGKFVEAPRMIPFGSPVKLEPPTLDFDLFTVVDEITDFKEEYEKDYYKIVDIYKNPEKFKPLVKPKNNIIH
jgi:hypothetical protein